MLFHSLEFVRNEVQLYMYYEDKVVVIDSKRLQSELELFHDGNKVFTYKYSQEDSYVGAMDMFVDLLHMCSMLITEVYHERVFGEPYNETLMKLIGEYVCQFYATSYEEIIEGYSLIIDSLRKCIETRSVFLPKNVGDLLETLRGRVDTRTFDVDVYKDYIICELSSQQVCIHVETLLSIFELDGSSAQLEEYRVLLRNIYAKTLLPVLASYIER